MEELTQIGLKLAGIMVAFTVVMTMVAYTVLAERRILGFIQGRLGPNRVGPGGFLQPLADLIKFIFKEDIVPDKSTRFIYFLAPVIATTAALMTIVVYPFGPEIHLPWLGTIHLVIARFDVALLYVLGVTSVGVYGIALAGWSSNNKYSLMGGLRSSAQMISYELALGLALIGVILQSGTLDLYRIVDLQSGHLGVTGWNLIWVQPLGFLIYLIAAIAETNRVPFDLPEAETELVAGFHTEYSAMKFALFAPFIAAVQVIVYAGAIMVLVVFVIMLLNVDQAERQPRRLRSLVPIAVGLAAILFAEAAFMIFFVQASPSTPTRNVSDVGLTASIGTGLFTSYLLPFEITSILLLMAIVGAMSLARRGGLISHQVDRGETETINRQSAIGNRQ